MTILGCDDAGHQCHYIATVDKRWETIASCDAVAESHIGNYANRPYPVIAAVCQPQPPALPVVAEKPQENQMPAVNDAAITPEQRSRLAATAIERVRNILPTTEGIKSAVTKPLRLVEDGYSWVARRISRQQ